MVFTKNFKYDTDKALKIFAENFVKKAMSNIETWKKQAEFWKSVLGFENT